MSNPFREARNAAGLTQMQLMAATGVPQRTVSDFDRGYTPRAIRAAARLAAQVGLTLDGMFPAAASMPLDGEDDPTEVLHDANAAAVEGAA
jgi:transcriptional regulator with XRE-family HTH domain